jgi:acyl carrier protein
LQALEQEIKELVIAALSLEDLRPQDIATDAPLFVDGLGLDSIDALELGVALQKRYGVTLSADPAVTRSHFASIAALARFVAATRTDGQSASIPSAQGR